MKFSLFLRALCCHKKIKAQRQEEKARYPASQFPASRKKKHAIPAPQNVYKDRKAVLIHLENDSSMEIKHGILQALNYEDSQMYGDKLLLSALIYIKF